MTFSDTAMMELGITQSTNIHNTRSLIRTLKYVLDILQTEEAFTVEEYKHTHIHTRHRYDILLPGRNIVLNRLLKEENTVAGKYIKNSTI